MSAPFHGVPQNVAFVFIMTLGVVTNPLVIYVMQKNLLKSLTISIYLTALACEDFTVQVMPLHYRGVCNRRIQLID